MYSHYVNYSSPDNMCSRLDNAKSEINKDQVYLIKNALTKLKNIVKNVPKNRRFKIEESEKIIDIVERILELNNENQMPSRLQITLAQLKTGNNSQKTYKWNQATIAFFVPFKKLNQNSL